ncbi:hypothetical protein RF55_23765 [Lasius niger]|uniref:Uncharacterized protein n=1 Tax=Lasius niger TaxID=67767 RepID=A0A0J7JVG2_LASNI|nr:hypothetical protein RF55_23765 [Lasius niger]
MLALDCQPRLNGLVTHGSGTIEVRRIGGANGSSPSWATAFDSGGWPGSAKCTRIGCDNAAGSKTLTAAGSALASKACSSRKASCGLVAPAKRCASWTASSARKAGATGRRAR